MHVTFPDLVRRCPLVVSVQTNDGSAVDSPEVLAKLALASRDGGVEIFRAQGSSNIRAIATATGMPVIGLIKRSYPDSEVYITATLHEVDEAIDAGAPIVALDATARPRPGGISLEELIRHAHERGALVLADIDSPANAVWAVRAGADAVSTTLAGYTREHPTTVGPDLEALRATVLAVKVPVFAEGRYAQRWQVEAALRMGATGVIVGGAVNDPVKQTKALMPTLPTERVGAVDIGGTWLRYGTFSADWKMLDCERTPNPQKREDRLQWIRDQVTASGVTRLGIGTGGVVDPMSGVVWKAKEYLMPDHIGIEFSHRTLGVPTFAFGDGHAQAWGHANLPQFAGRRVATLALGTGVGAGFVREGKIWSGRRGEYPRINDLPALGGKTYEDLLGGLHLTREPNESQKADAITALESAFEAIHGLYFPDDVVLSGSVALSPWLAPHVERLGAHITPFAGDAGLFGAAALALYSDWLDQK